VPALRIEDLHHDHAGERALRGISFAVEEGRLFGLIGADGAGKSTLFQILSTLLEPGRGKAEVMGFDTVRESGRIRPLIGYMPQRFSLYADLSVQENLEFAADIVGLAGAAAKPVLDELIGFARLDGARNRPAGKLSGGMKQKLALCCALVRKPRLLLLDEPTVGVDPVTRRDFWDMLKLLRSQGRTTVVSTPYMDEAALCDEVALIHHGEILAKGSPAELGASLPGRLWRLHGETSLHVPTDAAPPAPLLSLYVTGGDLHALAPHDALTDSVLESVRSLGLPVREATRIEPSVEDVLLHALQAREAA
jgi:ABC-type multidrug transport system ATPase subunit